jgi:hypothetical protein
MDEREWRIVIKFLWLQEQGSRTIHAHFHDTLGDLAVSLPTVKRWLHRFREGNTFSKHRNRPRRSLTFLGDVLSKFLSKFLFGSAKNIASQFCISLLTLKDLFVHEFGLRNFTRKRAQLAIGGPEKDRVTQPRWLLDLLRRHQIVDFTEIATGDESWFRYLFPARMKYDRTRTALIPCVRTGIGASNVMITFFSQGRSYCF